MCHNVTMNELKNIAVFCASSNGTDEAYKRHAIALGKAMLKRNIGMVYGGGNRGLMGIIAHTIHEGGGTVIGVLPRAMDIPSVTTDTAATEIRITEDMHERKSVMYGLSDAFVAMPGGIGTIEEIAEIYTWRQLRYHQKNIAFYNAEGYWDPFIAQLDKGVETGFIRKEVRDMIIISDDPEEILDRLASEAVELPDKLSDQH